LSSGCSVGLGGIRAHSIYPVDPPVIMSPVHLRRLYAATSAFLFLTLLTAALVGCDPLAPPPTVVVIVLTTPPPPTAIPSDTPPPTNTPSATPRPTATLTPTFTPRPTITPFTCTEQDGRLVEMHLTSEIAKRDVPYLVYLPPCYADTGRRYPFVVLLHGADQSERLWVDYLGIIRALDVGISVRALPPMIVIMPGGGDVAGNGRFNPQNSYSGLIVNELLPDIEKNFCTWNEREGRAIGGISRGGLWAFIIALQNPALFLAVGGHSPYLDLDFPANRLYNPLFMAEQVVFPPGEQPRIWLDIGTRDSVLPLAEAFRDTLQGRGIAFAYTANPDGEHSEAYWRAHLTEYLAFYGATWTFAPDDLPSCLE